MRIHLITTAAFIVIFFMSRSGSSQTNLEPRVAETISLLSSGDYETRFKAGDALRKLGTNAAPAIPAVMQLLETNPEKFHDVMIRVLENCPSEAQSCKPTLEKSLQSSSPFVRI